MACFFFNKRLMLGITTDFDISARLALKNPQIIYHHMKKYYLRKTKRTNNKKYGVIPNPCKKEQTK